MANKTIGIMVIATNAYFVLGLRFINRFTFYYKGIYKIKFFIVSDTNPKDYLPNELYYTWYEKSHKNWASATNSKFKNMLEIQEDIDYLYYFDADTNISSYFTEEWFLGDLVGGEHWAYVNKENEKLPLERYEKSQCCVPKNSARTAIYYYGAFFGGKKDLVHYFCNNLLANQKKDKEIGFEPGVNDESYINHYFHYSPPSKIVRSKNFKFLISCKGGLDIQRRVDYNIENIKQQIKQNKNNLFNILHGEFVNEVQTVA